MQSANSKPNRRRVARAPRPPQHAAESNNEVVDLVSDSDDDNGDDGAPAIARKKPSVAFSTSQAKDETIDTPSSLKRKNGSDEDKEPSRKRQQLKKNFVDVQNFICLITLGLLFDPVTASNGKVYEHAAITRWMNRCEDAGDEITAPDTREKITRKLVPNLQVRNHIENLVRDGMVEEKYVKAWNDMAAEKKAFDKLLKQAEEKNVKAMEQVADYYETGELDTIPADKKQAYKWYNEAYIAGSVIGMASLGDLMLNGTGVRQKMDKGRNLLFIADAQGSDYAAFCLGMDFADGQRGLPCNKEVAVRKLEQCLSDSCKYKNMDDEEKDLARQKLQELKHRP